MICENNVNSIDIKNIKGNVKIELTKDNIIEVICDNSEIPIKEDKNCIYIGENNKYNFISKQNGFFRNVFSDGNINIHSSNCVIINGKVVNENGSNTKEIFKGNIIIKVPFDLI